MNFKGRDIIDINDFTKPELLYILKITSQFEKKANPNLLKGKIAALLFFEPSTRTEQSFQSAAQRIGCGIIGFNDASTTSVNKGESFEDTLKIMAGYSDILIMRHPKSGSAKAAADLLDIPVVNAGDGPNQHPTQTFLDLYTIWKKFKTLNNLKIAFVGDTKNYRTMHSLAVSLSQFSGDHLFGISPHGLEMPEEYKKTKFTDMPINMKDLNETLKKVKPDIVYAGRIPKEYIKGDAKKYHYEINSETLKVLPKNCLIMHPLPRVEEINPEIDSDPRAIYFEQAKNGLFVRMTLLALILEAI